MDGFPSGQRGQTVNLLAPPSKVRILLHPLRRRGGTGRRAGLKILWWQHRTGSIPVAGSKLKVEETLYLSVFSLFFISFFGAKYLVQNGAKPILRRFE